jgi:hypothetical protein
MTDLVDEPQEADASCSTRKDGACSNRLIAAGRFKSSEGVVRQASRPETRQFLGSRSRNGHGAHSAVDPQGGVAARREVIVARLWIRTDKYGRKVCIDMSPNTCYRAHLASPTDDPSFGDELRRATERVNGILDEISDKPPDTDQELAILAYQDPDGGPDGLVLGWIDTSGEARSYFDKGYP